MFYLKNCEKTSNICMYLKRKPFLAVYLTLMFCCRRWRWRWRAGGECRRRRSVGVAAAAAGLAMATTRQELAHTAGQNRGGGFLALISGPKSHAAKCGAFFFLFFFVFFFAFWPRRRHDGHGQILFGFCAAYGPQLLAINSLDLACRRIITNYLCLWLE